MNTKKCSKCKVKKSINEFWKHKLHKDGLQYRCKECIKKDCQQSEKRIKRYQQLPEVKEKRKNYMKNYRRLTRHANPQIRLNDGISCVICQSLNGNKNGRHWEDLVGYTLNNLKTHLENLFDKYMSWDNYGYYWHIDHIKPKSLFHFTKPEDKEFKECWTLNNLQPLEAIENIKKGNRYIE